MSGPGLYSVTPRLGGARSEAANPHTSTRLSLSHQAFGLLGPSAWKAFPCWPAHPPPSSLYPGHPVLLQEAFPDMSYQAGEGHLIYLLKALISLS